VIGPDVLLSDNSRYTVQRGNEVFDIKIPANLLGELSKEEKKFIDPLFPFKVGEITPGFPAEKAGLKKGDIILAINDTPIGYFHELQENLKKLKGSKINLKVQRGAKTMELKVMVDKEGRIGFVPDFLLHSSIEHFTFLQSVPKGTKAAFSVISTTVKGLLKIIRGDIKATDSLSGPIGIAKAFGGQWVWQKFWGLVGYLSMVLAFMNFLPIPALDGGHVVFLGYEMIARRKPSDKFMEIAQKIGMVILLALMVFVFGNDIYKIISKWF
jgi:regulator of sigma E protease